MHRCIDSGLNQTESSETILLADRAFNVQIEVCGVIITSAAK